VAQKFIGLACSSYPSSGTQDAYNYDGAIQNVVKASLHEESLAITDFVVSPCTLSTRRSLQEYNKSLSFEVSYFISASAESLQSFEEDFISSIKSPLFITSLHQKAHSANSTVKELSSVFSTTFNISSVPVSSSSSAGIELSIPANDEYIFITVVVLTLALSIYIHRGRSVMTMENDDDASERRKIVSLSLWDISFGLLLVIVSMAAQQIQTINFYYNASSKVYAYLLIGLRVFVATSTLILLHAALFRLWLAPFLEAKHLHASFMFTLIILVSLFDPSSLRLLPWQSTPFSDRAGGMPNYTFFKIVNAVTLINSIGVTCVIITSIIVQEQGDRSETVISLSLSILNFIVSLLTVLLRIMAEKIYDYSIHVTRKQNDVQVDGATNEEEDDIEGEGKTTTGDRFSLRMRMLQEQEAALQEEKKQIDQERAELLRRERELCTQAALDLVLATKEKGKQGGALYTAEMPHADENLLVMRNQLLKKGEMPLMYIPLDELQAELNEWIAKINRNEPYDEKRLDFLVACLEINPDAIAEQQRIRAEWDAANTAFLDTCFIEMFGFIPPDIGSLTIEQLMAKGYSKDLAKRLLQCKALRLLRLSSHDIGRIYESDLALPTFDLDLRELCAIYAKIRHVVFRNDQRGTKVAYRNRLYEKIVSLRKDDLAGKLAAAKKIHPAYTNNLPLYSNRESLTEMDLVAGNDPFGRQSDFMSFSNKGEGAKRISELEIAFASTRLSAFGNTTSHDHIPNPLAPHLVKQDVIHASASTMGTGTNANVKQRSGLDEDDDDHDL